MLAFATVLAIHREISEEQCLKRIPELVLKLFLAMYSFRISIDEHVHLKFLMTKRLRKITKIYLRLPID